MTAVISGADRADARRNRVRVLAAAMEAFAGDGLHISLGEVARRAGVGSGTVYRHFPSKEILLEAVLVAHVDSLVAVARRWRARAAPSAAFFGFLRDTVEKSGGRKHICDVVTADTSWPRPMLASSVRRFNQVLAELLEDAQRAGGVRADLRPDDIAALMVGCAAMVGAHHDRVVGERLIQLVLDGLRPSVTEQRRLRDTNTGTRCAECAAPLQARTTGRPARYCGPTCRQRARRRRDAS
jgi:AcrR family transcriptional regulator